MFIGELLNVYEALISGAVSYSAWLFTPLSVIGISPILLITGGGLLVYLVIAIAKWIIS